jgi:hypothetical protein
MNGPDQIVEFASDNPLEPAEPQTAPCENLPLQTITPRNPVSTNLRASATNFAVNGADFWSTVWYFKVRPIKLTLKSDCRRNVTLSLVMRTCLPYASSVAVMVNGRTLHTYNLTDDNWFTQHIPIPADVLEHGANHILLKTPATAQTRLGIPLGIWVQSASVGWNPGLIHAAGV